MNVGMLGVVVSDCHPFEFGTEVVFHSLHHIPCKALQIHPVTKLRDRISFPKRPS